MKKSKKMVAYAPPSLLPVELPPNIKLSFATTLSNDTKLSDEKYYQQKCNEMNETAPEGIVYGVHTIKNGEQSIREIAVYIVPSTH